MSWRRVALCLLLTGACRAPAPVPEEVLAAFLPEAREGLLAPPSDATQPARSDPAPPAPAAAAPPFRPLMLLTTPAPSGALGDGLESFAGRDADVRDVLALLFAGGGLDYMVAADVHGRVSFDIRSTTRAEAFLELLRHVGLSMGVVDGRVVLGSRERRRFDVTGLGLAADELLVDLRALLDPHGYGVRLPDGRLEVETSATAMEHVVAWLDGQLPALSEALPFRVSGTPAEPGSPQELGVSPGRLGSHELAEALALRALHDVLAGRPIAAARRLEDALALEPGLALAHLADGLGRLLAGDVAGARAPLERAAAAAGLPIDRLARTLLALDDLAAGRDDAALAGLQTIRERWDDPRSITNLAGALHLSGRPDQALAVARVDTGSAPAALSLLRAWLFARADWLEAAQAEVAAAAAQGLSVSDEGYAQVLSVLDALQRGQSPFGELAGRAGGGATSDGAAVQPAPASAGVRERFDSSWH